MFLWPILAAICLVALDQVTKYMALTQLKPIGNTTVIEGFLDLTFVENHGVAFGLLSGNRWLILVLTIAICVVLVYVWHTLPRTREYRLVRCCLVLVFSGAIGTCRVERVAPAIIQTKFSGEEN